MKADSINKFDLHQIENGIKFNCDDQERTSIINRLQFIDGIEQRMLIKTLMHEGYIKSCDYDLSIPMPSHQL